MPEPASIILRRALSDFERTVLIFAWRGGPEMVARECSGIKDLEHAKVVIAETRVKAERAAAAASASDVNGDGHRGVAEAAVDVAGVPAEQAGTMLEAGAGATRPPSEAPPTLAPAPDSRFAEYGSPPARREMFLASTRSDSVAVQKMIARERRAWVLRVLAEGPLSQVALAKLAGCSSHSIANDIAALKGKVERTGRTVIDWPRVGGGRSSTEYRLVGFNPTPAPEPEPEPEPDVQNVEDPNEEEQEMSTELVQGPPPPFAGVSDGSPMPEHSMSSAPLAPAATAIYGHVLPETHDGVYFSYMALLFDLARYDGCPEHVFDRIEQQVQLGPPTVRRSTT